MWPSRTPPGAKPPSDCGPNDRLEVAPDDVGARGQPGVVEAGRAPRRARRSTVQWNARARLAGERAGQHPGVRLVVGVGVGVGRALHLLRGDR